MRRGEVGQRLYTAPFSRSSDSLFLLICRRSCSWQAMNEQPFFTITLYQYTNPTSTWKDPLRYADRSSPTCSLVGYRGSRSDWKSCVVSNRTSCVGVDCRPLRLSLPSMRTTEKLAAFGSVKGQRSGQLFERKGSRAFGHFEGSSRSCSFACPRLLSWPRSCSLAIGPAGSRAVDGLWSC